MSTQTNGTAHDKAGRFAPGNPGGPGRPRREVEAEYLAATMANVTAEAWGRIVAKAVVDAEAGDRHAREWLARMLGLGLVPALEVVTGPDLAPVERGRIDLLNEPDYLDYLRAQAAAEDGEPPPPFAPRGP
ncbi:MAG TPA: hypothetical protein VMV69_16505 [Pirellulales bacterium]|nr:hypothetical protein [Pirellulales bacterium]